MEAQSEQEKSLVIRQNSEFNKRCSKKTKHAKFSKKQLFLTPYPQSGQNKKLPAKQKRMIILIIVIIAIITILIVIVIVLATITNAVGLYS